MPATSQPPASQALVGQAQSLHLYLQACPSSVQPGCPLPAHCVLFSGRRAHFLSLWLMLQVLCGTQQGTVQMQQTAHSWVLQSPGCPQPSAHSGVACSTGVCGTGVKGKEQTPPISCLLMSKSCLRHWAQLYLPLSIWDDLIAPSPINAKPSVYISNIKLTSLVFIIILPPSREPEVV